MEVMVDKKDSLNNQWAFLIGLIIGVLLTILAVANNGEWFLQTDIRNCNKVSFQNAGVYYEAVFTQDTARTMFFEEIK